MSVFTIPYMINMESLFEFYARIVLKRSIDSEKYILERYSRKLFIQKDIREFSELERGIHLMPYCIPDIIICNAVDKKPVAVFDAKYKPHVRSVRSETHQLLSYVFLTGVDDCGFIFPGEITHTKIMQTTNDSSLPLAAEPLRYYELIFGNDTSNTKNIIDGILL